MALSKLLTDSRELNQVQQNVATALLPLESNPLAQGQILESQSLGIGDNTIYHNLGRTLRGWFITSINGAATIYDKQSTNTTPQVTLVLNSSAAVTVNLYVF